MIAQPIRSLMGVGQARGWLKHGEQSIMDEFLKLKQLVDEIEDDINKAVGGNKAAGTRVRKIMQDIKNTAQEVRKKVLDLRGPDEPKDPQ